MVITWKSLGWRSRLSQVLVEVRIFGCNYSLDQLSHRTRQVWEFLPVRS